MSTLLLRLAGPQQSWGTQSRFKVRDCGTEPSKSGVIGLVCSALGRPRTASVDDLAALRMGVRVDLPGTIWRDYQTAGGTHQRGDRYGVAKADGSTPETLESSRYFLADADFLVGLEGDTRLLEAVQAALAKPVHQLFLGRKAFVPGVPPYVPGGLAKEVRLKGALSQASWPGPGRKPPAPERRPDRLLAILESTPEEGEEVRRDQPVGAAFHTRQFRVRYVTSRHLLLGSDVPIREE